MNEKLMDFLELSTTRWDNICRSAIKPIPIFTFVDAEGGSWNLKDLVGPCGGKIESRGNAFRQYWYCAAHEDEGVIINLYFNNSWCWLPPWKEVEKR